MIEIMKEKIFKNDEDKVYFPVNIPYNIWNAKNLK